MANGRCRMHGGRSTGARTTAGKEKCRLANLKSGKYTGAAKEKRKELKRLARYLAEEATEISRQLVRLGRRKAVEECASATGNGNYITLLYPSVTGDSSFGRRGASSDSDQVATTPGRTERLIDATDAAESEK